MFQVTEYDDTSSSSDEEMLLVYLTPDSRKKEIEGGGCTISLRNEKS